MKSFVQQSVWITLILPIVLACANASSTSPISVANPTEATAVAAPTSMAAFAQPTNATNSAPTTPALLKDPTVMEIYSPLHHQTPEVIVLEFQFAPRSINLTGPSRYRLDLLLKAILLLEGKFDFFIQPIKPNHRMTRFQLALRDRRTQAITNYLNSNLGATTNIKIKPAQRLKDLSDYQVTESTFDLYRIAISQVN